MCQLDPELGKVHDCGNPSCPASNANPINAEKSERPYAIDMLRKSLADNAETPVDPGKTLRKILDLPEK